MTTRTVTYKTCNGCGNSTLDGAEIVKSYSRWEYDPDAQTIDVCADCDADGKFICRYCNEVHNDYHPCEALQILDKHYLEGEAYHA